MAIHGKSRDRLITALRSETDYKAGSAMIVTHLFRGWGRYEGERPAVEDVRTWVYSYATPIAWVMMTGEVVNPAQRYSATTTNHQNLAACYLGGGA